MGSRENRASIKALTRAYSLNILLIFCVTAMFPFSLGVGLDRLTHFEV